jgi:hypothetical protein
VSVSRRLPRVQKQTEDTNAGVGVGIGWGCRQRKPGAHPRGFRVVDCRSSTSRRGWMYIEAVAALVEGLARTKTATVLCETTVAE